MGDSQSIINTSSSRACPLLETTDLSVDAISRTVGFGPGETLRYHFRQVPGVSPLNYHQRFSASPGDVV